MKNIELRKYARSRNIAFWQIAQVLEISEPTMTRKLRTELSADEKEQFMRIIDELAAKESSG